MEIVQAQPKLEITPFGDALNIYNQIKSQIEAAVRAENRMINVELSVPAPPGGINGLKAARDRHAQQVLRHLYSAKSDSKLLPDWWSTRPFDTFMGGKDRLDRSRKARWGEWV